SDFSANGKSYPESSYVIYAGQAFRPHLLDMMEPQSYPERRLYPDGPPEPPYDLAGWTLPLQMGVQVDRADEPFDVDAEHAEVIEPFAGGIGGSAEFGYLIPSRSAMSSVVVNRMLSEGHTIYRTAEPLQIEGRDFGPGAFIIERRGTSDDAVHPLSADLGITVTGLDRLPDIDYYKLNPPKIGMYQSWTANIDEGWTRWVFDNYGFNYGSLHDADIRNGELADFDIIILPAQSSRSILRGNEPGTKPDEFTGGLGAEGALALKKFAESGGTILGWDGSTDFLIDHLGLPVENNLRNASREDFYIPGSLVAMTVDNDHPFAYGIQTGTAAFFVDRGGSQSRSFSVIEPAEAEDHRAEDPPVEVFARFAKDNILLSGWALGEEPYLGNKPSAVRVGLGDGQVVLLGFRPQFRAQPRATFNFVFNAVYASSSEGVPGVQPAFRIAGGEEQE
ncbi:MAG: hypothetical protein WD317_01605, partial [Balneolaceae bacterium]